MRILILDPQGVSVDWALRCLRAGHRVKVYIPNKPRTQMIGQGLLDKVDDWRRWWSWADLVFLTDNTKYLKELDQLRRDRMGPFVVGATDATSDWELDRDLGMSMFRKKGIDVAPSRAFTDYDAAIRYVKKEDRAFVSKPSGDADKALSYVGKSPEDLIFMLERWKRLQKIKSPFILQEKITGVEMAVGGWFGPAGFRPGWCENWEFKKLMNGDLGPNTGEQGTIVRYTAKSKLADKVLKPFAEDLAKANYTGYIDVNCIIDDKGTPWPLEFTMRPGWPTFNIQQILHAEPVEWLMSLAQGRPSAGAVALEKIACGVVLAIPDYPFNKLPPEESQGIPIYGMKPSMLHFMHPCDIALGEAPQRVGDTIANMPIWVTAGSYCLVTSGMGSTVEEARRHAYQVMSRLSLPNSPMYRTDIGQRLSRQLPELQALGYATGMTYKAT